MKPETVIKMLNEIISPKTTHWGPVGVWFSNGSKQFQVCRYFSDYKIFHENFDTLALTQVEYSLPRNEITFWGKSYPCAVFDLDRFDEAMIRFGTVLDEEPGKIICG